MARKFWNGEGEIEADEIYFTTNAGVVVGRPEIRERVRRRLARWAAKDWSSVSMPLEARKRVVAATVDNDEWLGSRNGCTVGSVERDAVSFMLENETMEIKERV